MKRLTLLFIGLLMLTSTHAQEIEQSQIDVANSFVQAVMSHKKGKIIKNLDKKYRKKQIKFLGGNKV